MKKILLVDDSDVIATVVTQTLHMHNYEDVLRAKDGEEGLALLKENINNIALCIFDVNMPKMDGITLVKEARRIDKTTPIIMLTTETDKSKMITAKEYGATGWIVKPFDAEKFMKVVEMYLKK
ncbi:MAG TPA: response regulator [Spirochaetota bacterium]|nr:response regulator [Spirochaetota bacterium]HRU66526.1 response regulator [Spirochaetota bacterium]